MDLYKLSNDVVEFTKLNVPSAHSHDASALDKVLPVVLAETFPVWDWLLTDLIGMEPASLAIERTPQAHVRVRRVVIQQPSNCLGTQR